MNQLLIELLELSKKIKSGQRVMPIGEYAGIVEEAVLKAIEHEYPEKECVYCGKTASCGDGLKYVAGIGPICKEHDSEVNA